MYYTCEWTSKNQTRPQQDLARSLRHPVSIWNTQIHTFSSTLTYSHPSGAEVLARRLIGTCTQMLIISRTSQRLPGASPTKGSEVDRTEGEHTYTQHSSRHGVENSKELQNTSERARIIAQPQSQVACSFGTPSQLIWFSDPTLQCPLISNHSSSAEVLDQGLIGTCARCRTLHGPIQWQPHGAHGWRNWFSMMLPLYCLQRNAFEVEDPIFRSSPPTSLQQNCCLICILHQKLVSGRYFKESQKWTTKKIACEMIALWMQTSLGHTRS